MTNDEWEELDMKAVSTIWLLLADEVMYVLTPYFATYILTLTQIRVFTN